MGCGSSNINEVVENNNPLPENITNKQTITQTPNLEKAPEINQLNQNINNTPNINNTEKNTLENTSRNKMNKEEKKDEINQNELLPKEDKNEIKFENKIETKQEKEMYDKPLNKNTNIKKKANNGKKNSQFNNNNFNGQLNNIINNALNNNNLYNLNNLDEAIDNYVNMQINNAFNIANIANQGMGNNNGNYNMNVNINNNHYDSHNIVNDSHNIVIDSHNVVINNNQVDIHNVVMNNNQIDSHNVVMSNNQVDSHDKVNNNNAVINNDYNDNHNHNEVMNHNQVNINNKVENNYYNYSNKVVINNNYNYNNDYNIGYDDYNNGYDDYNNGYNDNNVDNVENQQFDFGQNEEKRKLKEQERKKWEEEQEIKRKEEEKRRKEEEERRKKEEEERIKKEKERKKKERKYNTLEEFLKLEEERLKKEEEEILFQNKSKIDLYKKSEEEKEKQELKEKEESDNDQQRWKNNQKLGVKFRTSKEIKDFAKDVMPLYHIPIKYEIAPKITSPYNSGKISKETYDICLKYLNSLRFAAGLSFDIGLTDEYNKLAQDASLLCQVNNKLAHTGQPKPKNMDKKLYNSGAKGCATSNLGMGHINLFDSLKGWVSDADERNFDRVGHRRWVLNPTMKNTGLGKVKSFSAMYSFDTNAKENYVKNVAWPSQHMPIEFFGNNYPWSLSTDVNLDKKVTVTITNKKTKTVTKFDSYRNNKFLVNNDNFGQIGCVIFRPNFKYSEGDSFRVDVNCTKLSVSYDVSFFHIECTHQKEVLGTVKSSCMVKGKKILFCDKCGIFNEPLELEPHDEEVISYTKANCLKKGRKVFDCLTCCQKFDNEIGLQPHDYTFKTISSYKCEGTCKDCNKKININPPTIFNLWWTTLDKPDSYSSAIPDYNPIGSTILVWVEGVNGDKGYDEIIFEVDYPSLLKLPEKIINEPNNHLKVLGAGSVQLTIYPKYNPDLKQYANINLG